MPSNRSVSTRSIPPPISNLILLNLPRRESTRLFSSLELMHLKLDQVMHEAGDVIKSAYFMNSGMASLLTVQPDGESVEVGLIGKEGFVGLPAIVGFKTSALRVVTQADGTAYRADVSTLLKILPRCPELERRIQRFSIILAMQSAQVAACNRLHDVEKRLARWLMMSHDRIGGKTMPLTQEFLSQMLAIRRSSVSVAAGILQKAGTITYTRGNVTILDRAKLKRAACDCYGMICGQQEKWHQEN